MRKGLDNAFIFSANKEGFSVLQDIQNQASAYALLSLKYKLNGYPIVGAFYYELAKSYEDFLAFCGHSRFS